MHPQLHEEISRYVSGEDKVGLIPLKIVVPPDEVHVVNKRDGQRIHQADGDTSYWKTRWTQVFKLSTKAIPVNLEGLEVRDSDNTPFTVSAIAIIKLAEPGVAARLIGEDIALLTEEISKVGEAELRSAAVKMPLDEIMRSKDALAEQSASGMNEVARSLGFDLISVKITGIGGEVVQSLIKEREASKDRQITESIEAEKTAKTRTVEKESRSQAEEKKITERTVEEMEIAKDEALYGRLKEKERAQLSEEHELSIAQIEKDLDLQERNQGLELARRAKAKELELAEREKKEALLLADRKVREKELELQAYGQMEAARIEAERREFEAVKEADRLRTLARIEAEKAEEVLLIQAQAKLKAAEQEALTLKTEATALAEEQRLLAEGAKAQAMVEGLAQVELEQRRLELEARKIELERQEALNQAEATAARLAAEAEGLRLRAEAYSPELLAFELEKERIKALAQIEVARAEAMGQAWANANVQVFGGPETLASMSSSWGQGMALGMTAQGLSAALPENLREGVENVLAAAPGLLLEKGLGGKKAS